MSSSFASPKLSAETGTTTPPPQPTVTPSQPSPPAKPKSPLSLIVIVLLLIALGYLGYQNWQLQQQVNRFNAIIQVDNTPDNLSSPAPSTDPTANWKTYTDTETGFSLRYPSDYFVFQSNLSDSSDGFFVATSPTQGGDSPKFLPNLTDVWLTAFSSKNVNVQSLDEYLTSQQGSFQIVTKIPMTIGSMNGYKVVSTVQSYCAGDSCTTIYVYDGLILKDNNIYTIAMSSLDQKTLSANETMFDQILSTFKFLNSSGSDTDQIKTAVINHLKSQGVDPTQITITSIELLGNHNDKYVVSYTPGENYIGGGLFLLIGKTSNNKWLIPESGDTNYCNWVETSGVDESTKAFIGPTCSY